MSSSQLPRPSYIPIRDDARTLSLAECHCTADAAAMRADGRAHDAARPVTLEMDSGGGGSVVVQWGAGTRVHCRVGADLVAPPSNQPQNQGRWICSVDLSPAASTSVRRAAPVSTASYSSAAANDAARNSHTSNSSSAEANSILRTLEQCWAGEDREALCIVPGQLCWQIHAAVTVLDDAGNATDAAVLAATAALRHFRLPHVRLVDGGTAILDYEKEPLPLPLQHAPLTVSLIQRSGWLLLDPTDCEALGAAGHVTWGLSAPYGEILFCAGANADVSHLRTSHATALAQAARLHAVLTQALAQAEPYQWPVVARRMHRPNEEKPDDDDDTEWMEDATTATATTTTTEEEAAYRRRALDYTLRHVATAVRDDPPPRR